MTIDVLVANAGSSSLKLAHFAADGGVRRGKVDAIGSAPMLRVGAEVSPLPAGATHAEALAALLERVGGSVDAVGHRVVHGAERFTQPTALDDDTLAALDAQSGLAPLHNPPALAVVRAARLALPGALQIACFDTAFHARQPTLATRFALPDDGRTRGLRRYGFHGLSYQGLVEALRPDLPSRLLACHLGAGASLCAIRDGIGVATTMGYSPLDGLIMGTRCGAIDPGAVLELVRRLGVEAAERLLTRESGLLGLSGESAEMRVLEASRRPEAAAAIEHFVYRAARHAGSMIAALEGLDAIAFTGGVGENAAGIRAAIAARLAWTGLRLRPDGSVGPGGAIHAEESRVRAYVIACDEEAVIARAVRAQMRPSSHA